MTSQVHVPADTATGEMTTTSTTTAPAVVDGGIDAYKQHMMTRSGKDNLASHLENVYGIQVKELTELDLGVYRVDRADGPSWVARIFPAVRPLEDVEGDAEILRYLSQHGFPAERCAHADAVSTHEGQGVLVTEFVQGDRAKGNLKTYHALGDLLGRLHTLPVDGGAMTRDGGAWHHISLHGGPKEEIAAALSLLRESEHRVPDEQRALYDTLVDALKQLDDCHDLPHALVHPDFVPPNVIASTDGDLVLVDWTGVGRGPRISSLGFLLWAAGCREMRRADAVVAGYQRHVKPESDELARLGSAIRARPLIFDCWSFCMGRKELPEIVQDLSETRKLADSIATRAVRVFAKLGASS